MADYSDLVQRLRDQSWVMIAEEAANAIEELEAEVEKLKQLLNEGHSSLLKENEQLRWKCAAQESYEWLSRKQND